MEEAPDLPPRRSRSLVKRKERDGSQQRKCTRRSEGTPRRSRSLEERYRNELMAEEERLELREQIVWLKKKAGAR
jgi:hypothetical protein